MKRFILKHGDDYIRNTSQVFDRWGYELKKTDDITDVKMWKTKNGASRFLDNSIASWEAEVIRYGKKGYYSKQVQVVVDEFKKFEVTEVEVDENAEKKPRVRFSNVSWFLDKRSKSPNKNAYCRVCGVHFDEVPALSIYNGRITFRICPFCLQDWGEKGRQMVKAMDKDHAEEVEQERFLRKL